MQNYCTLCIIINVIIVFAFIVVVVVVVNIMIIIVIITINDINTTNYYTTTKMSTQPLHTIIVNMAPNVRPCSRVLCRGIKFRTNKTYTSTTMTPFVSATRVTHSSLQVT